MIHLADLIAATGARPQSRNIPERLSRFCRNARNASPGDLYVALDAEGQRRVEQALEAGASAALCETWTGSPDAPVLTVQNPNTAIRKYAQFAIRNFGTEIIAIAGGEPDAATTALLSKILSTRFDVFRTAKPIENSSDLWLSLGGLHPGHDLALIDLSDCRPEVLEDFANAVSPRVVLLPPNAKRGGESPLHADPVGTTLAGSVQPGGHIVVSATERAAAMLKDYEGRNLITSGIDSDSRISATCIRRCRDSMEFTLSVDGNRATAHLNTQVTSEPDSAIAAAAVAAALEMDVNEIASAISATRPTPETAADDGASASVHTVNADGPVWIKIDLRAVESNVRRILEVVGRDIQLFAVIKADGYGHGAQRIAAAALRGGASGFAVSRLSEVPNLRDAGITAPIIVLGHTPPAHARWAVSADCQPTVFDRRGVDSLRRAASSMGKRLPVHLKIDTGMGRLGATPEDAPGLAEYIVGSDSLELAGVMTHLGRAGESDKTHSKGQLAVFDRALTEIRSLGIDPGIVHAANTAAAVHIPESRYDMVRCGIAVYGLDPSLESPLPGGFSPAVTMSARVAQVKKLSAGTYVSYGSAGKLERDSTIAVVGAGYGDGFRRGPNSWGPVLVRGRKARVVGNVCMEMFMIDVTDIPGVKQGDEVVLIGTQSGETLSAYEAAHRVGTISYEIITQMLPRLRDDWQSST
ncbi:MAG: alanine racemase [Chloroflexi bacterium]|nr:alanine racemase [Chloroflexota bacterium]MCY3938488.1 alanine racemase [Chloroflexota bacterium]